MGGPQRSAGRAGEGKEGLVTAGEGTEPQEE